MDTIDEPGIKARAEALGLVASPAEWKVGYIHAVYGKGHEFRQETVTGWHIHCPYHGFICGNVSEREAHVLLQGFEAGVLHTKTRAGLPAI